MWTCRDGKENCVSPESILSTGMQSDQYLFLQWIITEPVSCKA